MKKKELRQTLESIAEIFEGDNSAQMTAQEEKILKLSTTALGWQYRVGDEGSIFLVRSSRVETVTDPELVAF